MDINYLHKENSITNNIIDENIYFEIIYNINQDKTKIFDNKFINKNKDKCKIIYKNKEYKLKEYFEDIEKNYNYNDLIKLKLRYFNNIIDISNMFEYCDKLLSFSDNHKRNKDHIIYITGDNENNNSLNTENSESYSSKSFIYHTNEKELTSLSSIRNISNDPNSITLSHICKKKIY